MSDFHKNYINGETLFSFCDKYFQPQLDKLQKMSERVEAFMRSSDDRFDFLYKRYETLTQEYEVINYQLKGIDKKIEALEGDLAKTEIKELRTLHSAFDDRLQSLLENLNDLKDKNLEDNFPRQSLAFDLKMLQNHVNKLEARIKDIELQLKMK